MYNTCDKDIQVLCCIQIDHEEVSIRRMVGAKKDSYYMDKKHVTWAILFLFFALIVYPSASNLSEQL